VAGLPATGMPATGITVGGGAPAVVQTPVQQPLSAEEQTILMELERERTKDAVKQGLMPPLPPTFVTPASPTSSGTK
jgi:hypothetical protein